MDEQQDAEVVDRGSMPLGFLAGFFGGCIGLAIVYIAGAKDDTKKGAVFGFVAQMVIGFGLRLALSA
ncbi:MAG: hypothetical protein K8H88_01140 [Sandaracinaceae bacterium]|nr:hypothetical protein [Sandaracinaceae bacterium]